jgi:WD40 repeat protein
VQSIAQTEAQANCFMAGNRDEFPEAVLRAVSRRAGLHCSNPACSCPTTGPQGSNYLGVINIGVGAHITAASRGGKRYDKLLTSEGRRSAQNCVWLCQNCAKLIDSDSSAFSVELLRAWKEQRERQQLEAISALPNARIAILERRLSGHANMVWDVLVTPDGRRIVSASNDRTAKVWDAFSGAELFTLKGHKAFVCSLSIASDSYRLATGAMDGEVIIWSLRNAEQLAAFNHGSDDVKVSWRPDGNGLVTGGADGYLRLWQSESATEIGEMFLHARPILKVACMRDNRRVVSVSADQTVRICDIDTLRCLQVFAGHTGHVNSVAITPDEKFLVSASGDQTLRIWTLETGLCSRILYGHDEVVWRVAISPDGRILASGSGDDTVRLWDIETGKLLQTLSHPDCIAAVSFSQADGRLVVGCDDAKIYVYRIQFSN